jgi:hypothetical protein
MTDAPANPPADDPQQPPIPPGVAETPYAAADSAGGGVADAAMAVPPGAGVAVAPPIGKVRSTGTCFLLMIVTLGFYSWYWYFKTHDEMKRHSGEGIGGGIALLLAIVVSIVMPFLNSNEVGRLYQRRGQQAPVTAVTGLWFLLLGWFFFVGAIVWFVKTNDALNAYWRSLGAS